MITKTSSLIALPLLALACPVAMAHLTLEKTEAPAGSYYKAVFQVPHGCEGAATTAVRVQVPDSIVTAKPQPKPGWKLSIRREKVDHPVDVGHGHQASELVREIVWSGGKLPDDQFDEFKVVFKLPAEAAGAVVYLPVVQECGRQVHRWVETPAAEGETPRALKEPAPAVRLLPRP